MNLSGVIVVVIVALWGSLLIPALVRRHDSVPEVRSVDRFSYALRILSRRTPYVPGRREVLVHRKPDAERRPVVSPSPAFVAQKEAAAMTPADRVAARHRALAASRRRNLCALVLALSLCLGAAYRSGGRWWLLVGVSAVLLVMYVMHLRTEAQQLAQLRRRRARAERQGQRQGQRQGARTRQASSRQRPARPAPARAAAVRRRPTGDAEPAAAAQRFAAPQVPATAQTPAHTSVLPEPIAAWPVEDERWEPMPVTLPTYVTKPVVSRPTVAPPTGSWFDGVVAEQRAARFASGGDVYDQMSDAELAVYDQEQDAGYLGLSRDDESLYGVDGLDEIIERRRAVND